MLVNGVWSLTDAAHAVERWDAHASSEVSIGSPAHRCFFELPADLLRNRLRFLVERGHPGVSLHRQTVDAAFDAELAMHVERFQSMELAIQSGGLLRVGDAHVDFGGGFGGD